MTDAPLIEAVEAKGYTIPTDKPESDGTFEWNATSMVVVHVSGGGKRGIGYSYASVAAVPLIRQMLAQRVEGMSALDVTRCWGAMIGAVRNLGDSALCMMAVAAVDAALWDLKAKILDLPLVGLLGSVRDAAPIYGSGGFTSYTPQELAEQLGGWVAEGIPRVKMKIGREPGKDPQRVALARQSVGPDAELFVDANGGYDRKQALSMAEAMLPFGVSWFEEPVVYHDLAGLRMLRTQAPADMEIAAGEYGFRVGDFRNMIDRQAVDVLQADATRCGITGFLQVADLCEADYLPLSSHCAPALHLHLGCAARPFRHLEYFHDHVRIESMLFDGAVRQQGGMLAPDLSRPGIGIELKESDAARYEMTA